MKGDNIINHEMRAERSAVCFRNIPKLCLSVQPITVTQGVPTPHGPTCY